MRVTTKTRSCIVTVTLITILPSSFRRRPNPWDHHSISPAKHLSKVVGWAGLLLSNGVRQFDGNSVRTLTVGVRPLCFEGLTRAKAGRPARLSPL
jgi:hypothetical protein